MSKKYGGGPAFPHPGNENQNVWPELGMSLRDYFAGRALSGLIARHRAEVAWSDVAPQAYRIADAMLAEREK